MCGVAGILGQGSRTDLGQTVKLMSDAMVHRGPDGAGIWEDENVALAHRRLSILDLSEAGAQPMLARSGRYVISFNGEIYNHAELRRQLGLRGPVPWRGHSDTEVILEAVDQWGCLRTLEAMVGMFAIIVWDRELRRLLLARDRLGEKPFYYGRVNGDFVCASELHAFRRIPGWSTGISRRSLSGFMRNGYVSGASTIYESVFRLPPGHFLEVCLDPSMDLTPQPYWMPVTDRDSQLQVDDEMAVAQLETLLDEAVRHQMMSDVPVGAFLSGGVDFIDDCCSYAEEQQSPGTNLHHRIQ